MSTSSQKIAVVMSTYNGQDYVAQQVESVLLQEGVDFGIFVRDDGSTDNTVTILEHLAQASKVPMVIERGRNRGVVGSFFCAMRMVSPEYTHIALCDQDDVWHPNKLARAMEVLDNLSQEKPSLYCSEYNFCNELMERTGTSSLNRIGITPSRMLYENVCSGNTMVFNRALLALVLEHGLDEVYCHDWWLALAASFFGSIAYDTEPCLEYRRTGSNASPTGSSPLRLLAFRVRTFLAGGEFERINRQNLAFLNEYGPMLTKEQRRLLYAFTQGPAPLKSVCPRRLRQKRLDDAALRLLLLLGF